MDIVCSPIVALISFPNSLQFHPSHKEAREEEFDSIQFSGSEEYEDNGWFGVLGLIDGRLVCG